MFNTSVKQISVGVAGSTERTVQTAQALLASPQFSVAWALTAGPKPIGRKQVVTPSPVTVWATQHQIPVIEIEKKIDEQIKAKVEAQSAIDILLVVDFGYLIPGWLLKVPQLAPLNIHPSKLPRWRGSSPGQFVLLYGEKESAVTLMVMDKDLDHGPILTQLPFALQKFWTQTEYYQHSFDLISAQLPNLISQFIDGQLKPQPQPDQSPTPVARRLSRDDGFIAWETLELAMTGGTVTQQPNLNPLLSETLASHYRLSYLIAAACRAFNPWPGIWTLAPTTEGQRRMKVINCHIEPSKNQLVLDQVQLEGKQPTTWSEAKKTIREK